MTASQQATTEPRMVRSGPGGDRQPRPWSAGSPIRRRLGRRKWDPQPTQDAAVLVASAGQPIPRAVIRQAVARSDGEPVAVVILARIYGSAFGLPNPGLMPTRRELQSHYDQAAAAVTAIERRGAVAWGQVAATRRPVKTIAQIAKARGVRTVLVVTPEVPRWRRVVEGDLARDIGRRLGTTVTVESVSP